MKKLLFLLALVALINWSCSSPEPNTPDGSGTTGTATGGPPNSGGNPYPSTTSTMGSTNTPDNSGTSH